MDENAMPWYQRLWESIKDFFINNWNVILTFLLVLIIGLIVIKILIAVFRRIFTKTRLEQTGTHFLLTLIRVFLYIIWLIALLSLLGVPTTSMIALFSAFALAISLALQNTISNLASGMVLIITKPFVEGHYIEVAGCAGTVKSVSIFSTRLVTPDNKLVVLPNNSVVNSGIVNYSANPTRRLDIPLSVAYGTDLNKVKDVATAVVAAHELVLKDPAPMVRLDNHGNSSLDFTLRVWVNGGDYWTVYFDLKEQIVEAFNANGIEIPFNQLDVHVSQTPNN